MKTIKVTNIDKFTSKIILKQSKNNKKIVESILKDVKKNGDSAIKKYEKKFTGAKLSSLKLTSKEISAAFKHVSKKELVALKYSKSKLEKVESKIKSLLKNSTIYNDGIKITKKFTPIESVGCYVPGGLAKYPSSVIMSVVPAKIAGVKRIVVVTPPDENGNLDPLTIVSAKLCGADEIYKTGGVQSIGALTYGTNSISKVDKIVGPGGSFVTTAKYIVSEQTGIDMLAGPTELGIIADNSANPYFVALDLISQAEHSSDTFCYLITNSEKLATQINTMIIKILKTIKRKDFVEKSLKNNGFIAICKTKLDMIKLANSLAPEHLQIMMKNSSDISNKITTAGLVLIGDYSPSSASDYLLGSNHILPTNGFGKIRGSLSVLDFLKLNTQVKSSKDTLRKISDNLELLTAAEGLSNHYEAVRGRIK